MDMNSVVCQSSTDNDVAERTRFESFKLGNANSTNNMKSNHRHAHSRSRNHSVSSVSLTLSTNSFKSMPDMSPTSPTFSSTALPTTTLTAKRNSHHRRRSSVSTRHESADMMGISVTDLPLSLSDDNINLGDKDSVRRRALWALEGKSDNDSFSKVEIPDISTPELNKKFEIPTKPSFPPSTVGSGFNNNMTGKRDSFGKHLTSSSSAMEHLHTLVEEDEEEEDKEDERDSSMIICSPTEMSPAESTVRSVTVTASTPTAPSRPRPANLNLRPLSLNKENIIGLGNLPTPPSVSSRPGLRSLTLAFSPSSGAFPTNSNTNNNLTTTNINRRQSLTISSATPVITSPRRPSLNLDLEPNFRLPAPPSLSSETARRASISYRSSTDVAYGQFTLPTPELTPTLQRHCSASSSSTGAGEWSLSETEQHFLYQAHATLVQRITDLERALAVSRSRPQSVSCASDASCRSSVSLDPASLEGPSDEMFQLIADLKAERDELNKDVEGWRVRVSDLDKQVGLLARRVDMERREAWVARERSGLLEIEKKGLEKSLEAKSVEVQEALEKYNAAKIQCVEMKLECEKSRSELQRTREIEGECERLKSALFEEKKKREELENSLESARLSKPPTPTTFAAQVADRLPYARSIGQRNLGFQSIDSQATDVEIADELQIPLKSVAEVREEFSDEEDDELARYEEEVEDDLSIQGSSISSLSETFWPTRPRIDIPPSCPISSFHSVAPRASGVVGHDRHKSLAKTWTFPKGVQASPAAVREVEVDKFFGCLEDFDNNGSLDDLVACAAISGDNGRGMFTRSLLQDDDDESPPFLLPKNIGYEIPEEKPALEVVVEEDEEEDQSEDEDMFDDEFAGEVVEGGIVFKFTPPEDSDVSSELLTPSPGPGRQSPYIAESFGEHDDEAIAPFGFPHIAALVTPPPKSSIKKASSVTPSSIPRAIALRTYTPTKSASPARLVFSRSSPDAFMTPPNKRGGTMPTFIPQPRTQTVSPLASTTKTTVPIPVRQQRREDDIICTVKSVINSSQVPAPSSMPQPQSHTMRPTACRYDSCVASVNNPKASIGYAVPSNTTDVQSPASTAKLTFQSFANLIPSAFSWSPRPTQWIDTSWPSQDAEPLGRLSFGNGNRKGIPENKEKSYVSKERQLEKLRSRLEEEQRVRRCASGAPSLCGKCDDKFVNL